MKISALSSFVTTGMALGAVDGAGSEPLFGQTNTNFTKDGNLPAGSHLRGSIKRSLRSKITGSSNGCRARVNESVNSSAVYTIVDANNKVCQKWIGNVIAECPGTSTLSAPESFPSSFSIPDNVLVFSSNTIVKGYVTAEGTGNTSIANCISQKFNHTIEEVKRDPLHKLKVGIFIAVGVVGVIFSAKIVYTYMQRFRPLTW